MADQILGSRARLTVVSQLSEALVSLPLPLADTPMAGEKFTVGIVLSQIPADSADLFAEMASRLNRNDVAFHIFGTLGGASPQCAFSPVQLNRLKKYRDTVMVTHHGFTNELRRRLLYMHLVVALLRRESFSRIAAEAVVRGHAEAAPRLPGIVDWMSLGDCVTLFSPESVEGALSTLNRVPDNLASARHRASSCDPAPLARHRPTLTAEVLSLVYRAVLR